MATVVLLVALRLSLGCHFLYEGVWKITPRNQFNAEPFLSLAKGPAANIFYAMLTDINGRERLQDDIAVVETPKGDVAKNEVLRDRWEAIRLDFVEGCRPKPGDKDLDEKYETVKTDSKKIYDTQIKDAEEYLTANLADIRAYFGSLDRFEEGKKTLPDTAYQKKRNWDNMQTLRGEAKVWLAELDTREAAYKNALRNLATANELAVDRDPLPPSWNPLRWTRIEQINFAVTYGLSAIGLCLVLGFCTRLAALGGGCFMLFVVLTQPAWPGIYPHDLPVVGHALLINKDFVEMVALFLIATTAVGRWGGLDYFLENWVLKPLFSKTNCCCKKEG